ncbi:hypothetical protein Cgig2_001620 [Carnegiea gigantea]|uniref:RING-type E3 ubiquitin transferase n=1 Tax=Carnegiea gigantea TaxID=171969 RepID=A0A9Q1GNI9_9CARY|nr:hypothetical protein Cgig2_001620 [Carnegiea gigantea]
MADSESPSPSSAADLTSSATSASSASSSLSPPPPSLSLLHPTMAVATTPRLVASYSRSSTSLPRWRVRTKRLPHPLLLCLVPLTLTNLLALTLSSSATRLTDGTMTITMGMKIMRRGRMMMMEKQLSVLRSKANQKKNKNKTNKRKRRTFGDAPEMLLRDFANRARSDGQNQILEGKSGAPPTAKSAVESLRVVEIKSEEESYVCAVCKDAVNVGDFVKGMPCGHGYHGACIILWLGARNSCPVCRFELSMHDSKYEEKRERVGEGRCSIGSTAMTGKARMVDWGIKIARFINKGDSMELAQPGGLEDDELREFVAWELKWFAKDDSERDFEPD